MNFDNYQHSYTGKDKYLLYFTQYPLKDWDFKNFESYFETLAVPPSKKSLTAAYKQCLAQIKDNKATPHNVKKLIETLLKEHATNPTSAVSSTTTYHINQGPSSVVNYGCNNTISTTNTTGNTERKTNKNLTLGHKRTLAEINESSEEEESTQIDSLFSNSNETLVPAPTSSEFRKAVYAYGVKALSKKFFLVDAADLQGLIKSFKPVTLKEELDMMSAKLLMNIDLNDITQVNALKLSLSHTIDFVNSNITKIFRQYLDEKFWTQISSTSISLCKGMTTAQNDLYQSIMTANCDNGKIDKNKLKIAVAKQKVALLESNPESNHTELLQVLDIIDMLTKQCLSDAASSNPEESELTSYRKIARVLDEILECTKLDMIDGESTCKASKSIAKTHETIYGSSIPLNVGFGRRIDLILSTKDVELSTSEWKRKSAPPAKCLKQQAKNIRMNKAILTYLLDLPIKQTDTDKVFTIGMDWIGSVGYVFAIKKVSDVYVAQPLSTLMMPTYLDDLQSFKETLDRLYAWRNHHLNLKDIILPALRKREQENLFASVLGTSISGDVSLSPNISPNIYLTPSKGRQSQASTTIDFNSEVSDGE